LLLINVGKHGPSTVYRWTVTDDRDRDRQTT
jgi:hypothetical protein